MQPLVAALALHHGLAVVDAIAYAARRLAGRQATAVGGGSVGCGRGGEGVGVVVVLGSGYGGGGGLGPALVVGFEGVLGGAV